MFKKYFTPFYIISALFSLFLITMSWYFWLFLGNKFVYLFFIILLPVLEKWWEVVSKELSWWDITQIRRFLLASTGAIFLFFTFNWYQVSYTYSLPFIIFFFCWFLHIDEKLLFSFWMLSLLFTVCFLLMKNQENANISAISLYMFLLYWTVLSIINFKNSPDEITD